jgi:uncharacterized protein YegJ (DUF2314 family)
VQERSWHLVNAEERAKETPDTFKIPAAQERKALEKGALAKLIFELDDINLSSNEAEGERMWVEITSAKDGRYEGKLDNDPEVVKALKAEDKVVFAAENIIEIWDDDE